jgi:hypothetical protein
VIVMIAVPVGMMMTVITITVTMRIGQRRRRGERDRDGGRGNKFQHMLEPFRYRGSSQPLDLDTPKRGQDAKVPFPATSTIFRCIALCGGRALGA